MVRNKSQSQDNLNDNRKGNQSEKLNNDRQTRGTPLEEEQRGNTGKGDKTQQPRKGSPGKTNH